MIGKSVAIASILSLSTASVFAVDPVTSTGNFGGGTISFTGSVTEAPCSIPPGESSQTIDLGSVSNKQLMTPNGPGSSPVSIKINLKNCDLGTDNKYTKASLKFLEDGHIDSTGKNKGLLVTRGSSNVAVQLLNTSGTTPIDFTSDATMKPGTEVTLVNGADSTISFMAHLIGVTGSTTVPTPGTISAQVSYQLSYY